MGQSTAPISRRLNSAARRFPRSNPPASTGAATSEVVSFITLLRKGWDGYYFSVLFLFGLLRQRAVESGRREQSFGAALFDDLAVIQDDQMVGLSQRFEAMPRDHDG